MIFFFVKAVKCVGWELLDLLMVLRRLCLPFYDLLMFSSSCQVSAEPCTFSWVAQHTADAWWSCNVWFCFRNSRLASVWSSCTCTSSWVKSYIFSVISLLFFLVPLQNPVSFYVTNATLVVAGFLESGLIAAFSWVWNNRPLPLPKHSASVTSGVHYKKLVEKILSS